MESLWATLKKELVQHAKFKTRAQARSSIFEWIEVWYQRERSHSSLGYLGPEAFEAARRVGSYECVSTESGEVLGVDLPRFGGHPRRGGTSRSDAGNSSSGKSRDLALASGGEGFFPGHLGNDSKFHGLSPMCPNTCVTYVTGLCPQGSVSPIVPMRSATSRSVHRPQQGARRSAMQTRQPRPSAMARSHRFRTWHKNLSNDLYSPRRCRTRL